MGVRNLPKSLLDSTAAGFELMTVESQVYQRTRCIRGSVTDALYKATNDIDSDKRQLCRYFHSHQSMLNC